MGPANILSELKITQERINRNVRTKDGAKVIILAYIPEQERTYLGAYYNRYEWVGCSWDEGGKYKGKEMPSGLDLVIISEEPPEEPEAA